MVKLLPQAGDYIECLKDIGNVDNSPWTSEVLKVTNKGYEISYDDGEKVYEIPDDAFTDTYIRDGITFFVVDSKSKKPSLESIRW